MYSSNNSFNERLCHRSAYKSVIPPKVGPLNSLIALVRVAAHSKDPWEVANAISSQDAVDDDMQLLLT